MKSKRTFIEWQDYLCWIWREWDKKPYKYQVWKYDRGYFSFENADYNNIELPYKYHTWSNITVILSARKI